MCNTDRLPVFTFVILFIYTEATQKVLQTYELETNFFENLFYDIFSKHLHKSACFKRSNNTIPTGFTFSGFEFVWVITTTKNPL